MPLARARGGVRLANHAVRAQDDWTAPPGFDVVLVRGDELDDRDPDDPDLAPIDPLDEDAHWLRRAQNRCRCKLCANFD